MIKLGIGIPAYKGTVASGQAKMWTQLGAALIGRIDDIELLAMFDIDMCGIDHARNAIIDVGKSGDLDWILMVDSDTWCEPGTSLIRMIIDAHNMGGAIVGCPVVMKDGRTANVFKYEMMAHHIDSPPEKRLRPMTLESSKEMIEVDGIGGAIIAVNLKRAGDTKFRFTDRTGEDLEFCHQLRQKGEKVLCDPRVKTLHVDKPDILAYEP